jgi:tripartite-type tricarboxylate transporter receptor subunit TctC
MFADKMMRYDSDRLSNPSTKQNLGLRWSIGFALTCFLSGAGASLAADDMPAASSAQTISFYVGASTGGGYDSYARTIAPFLGRYLPGKPTVIVRNMPAADGLALANYVNNIAPRDGTVLAISPAQVYLPQVLTPGKFNFDVRQFGWIGTISTTTDVLAVFKTTNVASIEDAKKKEVPLGAVGVVGTGTIYPLLSNALLGTKFRIIHGYPGGTEINLAMENGEVQGRVNQWNSWLTQRPNWIQEGKLSYLFQSGPPVLENVPRLVDLVTTPQQKAMVGVIDLLQLVGRSIYTTPALAPERLEVIRKAFENAVADPEFIEGMKRRGLELNPRKGTELQAELDRRLQSLDEVGRNLGAILNSH